MELLNIQKKYFNEGNTLSYNARKKILLDLKRIILSKIELIEDALYKDLNKSKTEAYMCEIGLVLSDLKGQIKNLKKNMKRKKVSTPIAVAVAKSYVLPSPYGNTLVIAPWNYPFLLSIQPVVAAIAAGNTVILKPSEFSFNTSNVIKEIFDELNAKKWVSVVLGAGDVASSLIKEDFDYIFYTGSTHIGKIIYEEAAKKLIPVTLELGGKSPVILSSKVNNIDLACKRIAFGKLINAGQTCVAPDYMLVPASIYDKVVEKLRYWFDNLYEGGVENTEYVKIINEKHFNRLKNLIDNSRVIHGGVFNDETLKISPTIIDSSIDDSIMKDEIFGPVLPIIKYNDESEIYGIVQMHRNPLALYVFSNDKEFINRITTRISFGGGCINDTIMHLANENLPFGGVGASGIGSYHGRKSFETFSHYKSIVDKANFIDVPLRYTPYSKSKSNLIKKFLK